MASNGMEDLAPPRRNALDMTYIPAFHNGMEHRWGRRMRCNARVRISAGAGIGGSARMRDVSTSGAFIETSLPLPVFSQVEIAVIEDNGKVRNALHGCVARRDANGVGIEWLDIPSGAICPVLGCRNPCAAAAETWNHK